MQAAASKTRGQALECRAEGFARTAPFGPEINYNGDFMGSFYDLLIELGSVDVAYEGHSNLFGGEMSVHQG